MLRKSDASDAAYDLGTGPESDRGYDGWYPRIGEVEIEQWMRIHGSAC